MDRMSEKAPRPGQATFAAWLIIGGSVILVLTAWQRISSLHTLEVQEELQRVLSEPPVSGTGLGLESLQTIIRILCMVAAGAATASAILGVHALKGSTSARLALTLLAPLILVGGFATAGFFAPLVVAGVVMLWLRPTRDWFAGRPWLPASDTTHARRHDPFAVQPREGIDTPAKPSVPPAQEARPAAQPGPHSGPYGAPLPTEPSASPSHPTAPAPRRRPGALVAACVLTWVSCLLVAGVMLLMSLVMAVARDDLFDEIERQQPSFDLRGMSEAELATGTFVMTAVVVVWCLAAAVVAVLALRGRQWARIALVVSAATATLVLMAASLVNPLLVVLLAVSATTIWLLLRADVSTWFSDRG